jgi:hypothetical protein
MTWARFVREDAEGHDTVLLDPDGSEFCGVHQGRDPTAQPRFGSLADLAVKRRMRLPLLR